MLHQVDSALDLSHTQNIGQMLKDHFQVFLLPRESFYSLYVYYTFFFDQHSQFIVVSLKDGMFNNANVLFR